MNRLLLGLADGTSFFIGLAAVLVAGLLLLWFRAGTRGRILGVVVRIGILCVVISAVPLPLWAYAIWLVASLMPLLLRRHHQGPAASIAVAVALLATTVGLCVAEVPYHCLPRVSVTSGETVYVVGDSLSAGMGTEDRCWPAVLGDMTGLKIVNLAQPGARVGSAMAQARRITKDASVVILEIGGNDLLGETDAGTFREQLDALVAALASTNSRMVMFELPLFPFKNAFGRAQRDVAVKYGVILIPKECLTGVLGMKGGTLDGLHLSQEGHNAMAEAVAGILGRRSSDRATDESSSLRQAGGA
jgi:acyl-CoA thioesterase-1